MQNRDVKMQVFTTWRGVVPRPRLRQRLRLRSGTSQMLDVDLSSPHQSDFVAPRCREKSPP